MVRSDAGPGALRVDWAGLGAQGPRAQRFGAPDVLERPQPVGAKRASSNWKGAHWNRVYQGKGPREEGPLKNPRKLGNPNGARREAQMGKAAVETLWAQLWGKRTYGRETNTGGNV